MAHIGKTFRLHHRRDLCIGCTNHRFSWPKNRTAFFTLFLPHISGPVFVRGQHPLYLQTGEWDWPIRWRSPVISGNGFNVRLEQETLNWNNETQQNGMEFRVLNGNDIVLSRQFKTSVGICQVFNAQSVVPWQEPYYANEVFWGGRPTFIEFTGGVLSWANEATFPEPPGGW